jgi:hypothetical protein
MTIQRIDARQRETGEAAEWEQEVAELAEKIAAGPPKGPQADKIARQREV